MGSDAAAISVVIGYGLLAIGGISTLIGCLAAGVSSYKLKRGSFSDVASAWAYGPGGQVIGSVDLISANTQRESAVKGVKQGLCCIGACAPVALTGAGLLIAGLASGGGAVFG